MRAALLNSGSIQGASDSGEYDGHEHPGASRGPSARTVVPAQAWRTHQRIREPHDCIAPCSWPRGSKYPNMMVVSSKSIVGV